MEQEQRDKKYMQMAIDEAKTGILKNDGGPFGTVIVKDGEVIGTGHNRVLANNDATAHGEIEGSSLQVEGGLTHSTCRELPSTQQENLAICAYAPVCGQI